ncbi:hypothetical protein BDQ17DRAFT_1347128 [Cyathus striatus]|nr:hypothetical protein BDQ17DRAFT_1347128 [Cyathus striatus]
MKYAQSHLIKLPYELQLRILFFLRPLDLLSLQRTCKQMCKLTSEKNLWIKKLKDMCEENAVFLPTYKSMNTMNLRDLMMSATRPDRFLSFLENSKPGEVLESGGIIGLIRFNPEVDEHPDLYLVPGGRYLFTFFYRQFLLFDLELGGLGSAVVANARAISESYVVSTTRDGLGLRVVLFGYNDSDNQSELKVFDIYPSSSKRECVIIATLNHPGKIYMHVPCACGDVAVLTGDNEVKIWNFVTQKATSWKVKKFDWITVTETTVMTISEIGISTWSIPDLLSDPLSVLFSEDAETLRPHTEIKLSTFSPTTYGELEGPCDWYTGMKMYCNELFDFVDVVPNKASLDKKDVNIPILYRFQLDSSHSARCVPSLVQKYCLEPIPDISEQVQPYRIVNSRLVSVWHEEPDDEGDPTVVLKTKLHVGASGLSRFQEPGKQYTLFKGDPIILKLKSFAFCPVSSRICYINESQGNGITVLDYVN